MLYLLKEFTKYGIAYPKRAKEIAVGTGISLTETYQTLRDLREKGLIWRIGKIYKYRYGLKEGPQLDNLEQIYNCLELERLLPSKLQIDFRKFDELQNKNKLKNEIILKENEEQRKIQEEFSCIRFLSREGREEAIIKCILRIIKFYSIKAEDSTEEEIMVFLNKEFSSIFPIFYGAEIKGDK